MNKNHNTKNKLLKNITLTGCLLSSFAGTFPQLQATTLHGSIAANNIKEAQRLLEYTGVNQKNAAGFSAIHFARTPEAINLLYYFKANVNATDQDGNTPLHLRLLDILYATNPIVVNNALTCARQLLANGADPTQPNNEGYTPLAIAFKASKSHIFCDGQRSPTPVPNEVHIAYTEILKLLQKKTPKRKIYELLAAAQDGDIEKVRLSLDEGIPINDLDASGYAAPLHLTQNPGTAQLLHSYGADANLPNKSGDTPLHFATSTTNPNLELVKALLQAGANPNIPNHKGRTPIDNARQAIQSRTVIDDDGTPKVISDENAFEYSRILSELLTQPFHPITTH
jgi:ankyrin repeat protein